MSKAIKVTTDMDMSVVELIPDESYNLIKDTVDGLFDCISLPQYGSDMWINDEGKINGLPINPLASLIYMNEYNTTDYIAGDVLLTGGVDEEGNTLGMTDMQCQTMLTYIATVAKIIIEEIDKVEQESKEAL